MSDPLVAGFVAGLFALLGAFIGAWLARRTEYEKWLRHARTEAFVTLVAEMHDARVSAATVFYDLSATEGERSSRLTEVYAKTRKHVARARLFMRAESRSALEDLTTEVWAHSSVKGGPAERISQINMLMNQLQALLEQEMEYLPWKVRWSLKSLIGTR